MYVGNVPEKKEEKEKRRMRSEEKMRLTRIWQPGEDSQFRAGLLSAKLGETPTPQVMRSPSRRVLGHKDNGGVIHWHKKDQLRVVIGCS